VMIEGLAVVVDVPVDDSGRAENEPENENE
jgi:hypothetical protein